MIKTLATILLIAFAWTAHAQGIYSISTERVCWTVGNDSTNLTRYRILSYLDQPGVQLVYTDAAGDTITPSGGTFSLGWCSDSTVSTGTLPVTDGLAYHFVAEETYLFDSVGGNISNGESIHRWLDISGNRRHLDSVGNGAPTFFSTGGPNGLPYVQFDRPDVMGTKLVTSGNTGVTVFAVCRFDDLAQSQYIVSRYSLIGSSRIWYARGAGTNNRININASSNGTTVSLVQGDDSSAKLSWATYSLSPTPGSIYVRVNGSNEYRSGGGSPLSTENVSLYIGGFRTQEEIANEDGLLDGGIAEVIVYESALTVSQVSMIEEYLRDKYATW